MSLTTELSSEAVNDERGTRRCQNGTDTDLPDLGRLVRSGQIWEDSQKRLVVVVDQVGRDCPVGQ